VAFWIAIGSLVIMAGWSAMTATYFAFHDDVIKHLIARQTAQQYAYEDRIAELRTEIDRTTSRELLDQQQFAQKLDELTQRQTTLEARADALSGVANATTTGSIRPAERHVAAPDVKPSRRGAAFPVPRRDDLGEQSRVETTLHAVEASLDRVEQRQTAALDRMDLRYQDRVRHVRAVLDRLGVEPHVARAATGGPFVPVRLPPEGQTFARALTRISIARAEAEDLNHTLTFVPLRQPLNGQLELTSPFGVRVDPFLGTPEMHTGMDFGAPAGTPVHATAAGKVTIASRDGGYGNMVEINHGEGLATRYAHLSELDVAVGQKVRVGQVIGRVGSTGRSTGPHLHYETRVNGQPINPEKFLGAGEKLFGELPVARADHREIQD
jgi:murein DD-endopeptidase MepM/ murein hydrolase activator NlpD